jgi:hypothetical protein
MKTTHNQPGSETRPGEAASGFESNESACFAASQRISSYPVSLLLGRLIADYGNSPAEFARGLGYCRIEYGLPRLWRWLEEGEGPEPIINRTARAYPAVEVELRLALSVTQVLKRMERQAPRASRCHAGG